MYRTYGADSAPESRGGVECREEGVRGERDTDRAGAREGGQDGGEIGRFKDGSGGGFDERVPVYGTVKDHQQPAVRAIYQTE